MTEQSIAEVTAGLTKHEADLLANRCTGWGSWMWMVAEDLCTKGLMKRAGDTKITLTEQGEAVKAHLISQGADHDR